MKGAGSGREAARHAGGQPCQGALLHIAGAHKTAWCWGHSINSSHCNPNAPTKPKPSFRPTLTRSILLRMEKLMKLVSMSTRYGGPSCVLYRKNSAAGVLSLPGAREHTRDVNERKARLRR